MPKLTLKFKDSVIQIYNFKKDKTICIGRRENNDIVISNLTVSGNHAKIDFTEKGYLLTDLKSKNKTYVNGKEVDEAVLKDQDVIGIGKHSLVFNLKNDHARVPSEPESGIDKTMALNVDTQKEIHGKAAVAGGIKAVTAVLVFVEGGEGRFELAGNKVRIGKNPSNDIVIKGFFTGKIAAVIEKTPEGYTLSHQGGLAKVLVNNRVVKRPVVLEEFDSIKIAGVELQFFYK